MRVSNRLIRNAGYKCTKENNKGIRKHLGLTLHFQKNDNVDQAMMIDIVCS